MNRNAGNLAGKLGAPCPKPIAEVKDFVDLLSHHSQDRALTRAASAASAPAFEAIWNDAENGDYDVK